MTDFSAMLQPDKGQPARTIHIVDKTSYPDWLNNQPERARAAIIAQGMKVEGYAHAILPGNAADDWSVVTVTANVNSFSSWCLAKLAGVLPPGTYRLASGDPGVAMFGWLTGQYRYNRYKSKAEAEAPRVLLTTDPVRMAAALREATAVCMVRDLVNAPAADLGPAELEDAAAAMARQHKAELTVTKGDPLEQGYPMIALSLIHI